MGDLLKSRANAQVDLVKSSGGVFEITVDGDVAFSKRHTGRFPNEAEIDALTAN